MKIDSPSSITPREASVRLEWISTRILPGVAVLLLSIPLCQWADSNLPDGIVPVSIIYLMIVIILWSMYMAVQYAFLGIAQTRKAKINATTDDSNPHEGNGQAPVFLLEAMPIVAESKKYKTKLSSFDVRLLVWNIAIRLGLGKGKVYSNDDCACYIERRFASLCVTASGEPLSHSTLRNLTVTSNSDQIHCDIQGEDGLLFHIPSQLGVEKD